MLNILFSSLTSSSFVSYCCAAVTTTLNFRIFFFWLKTKNQLMKSFIFLKTFPHLLIFYSTNSNLVTVLALYKEDQAIHAKDIMSHLILSLPCSLILKIYHFSAHKHIFILLSPFPLQKSLNKQTLQLLQTLELI